MVGDGDFGKGMEDINDERAQGFDTEVFRFERGPMRIWIVREESDGVIGNWVW